MADRLIEDLKRGLDTLLDHARFAAPPTADTLDVFDRAAADFRAGGAALLEGATQFMWEYYRAVAAEFSAAERTGDTIGGLANASDIWQEVEITDPPVLGCGGGTLEPARSYISFEGNVSWEREHGLQLVFENGTRVCKVGPYDGHNTNASAYDDASMLSVVFVDPRLL